MVDEFLNIGIGHSDQGRQLLVTNIAKKSVSLKDKTKSEKIIISTIEESSQKAFEISDAYVGEDKIAGLWFSQENNAINKASTLAKVLQYYEVATLKELIGKTIKAKPDEKNFLVLVAYD